MATDRELVNFSEEHELNTVLARHGKAQSIANREVLCELGKECKEKLGKRVLTLKFRGISPKFLSKFSTYILRHTIKISKFAKFNARFG